VWTGSLTVVQSIFGPTASIASTERSARTRMFLRHVNLQRRYLSESRVCSSVISCMCGQRWLHMRSISLSGLAATMCRPSSTQ